MFYPEGKEPRRKSGFFILPHTPVQAPGTTGTQSAHRITCWLSFKKRTRKFGIFKKSIYLYNMKRDRKTGFDYLKELTEIRRNMESLEAHVTERLMTLSRLHPEAVILKKSNDEFKAKSLNKYWVESASIETRIGYIRNIERWLNEKSCVKQTELEI